MGEENEFKLGDIVKCKFTERIGMVIDEDYASGKVLIRNSDNTKDTFFTFELIPYSKGTPVIVGNTR